MGADLDKLNGNGWESKIIDGLDPSYVVESSPGNPLLYATLGLAEVRRLT